MAASRLAILPLLILPLLAQPQLDSVVQRARTDFDVPGIAVAIVHEGKMVFAKGYGVSRLDTSAPVTSKTLFGVASNTKAFTAAALAILVDEGKLAWDDRVIDRLPSFQMSDPYVSREMRIRDLLIHNSGLALGAFIGHNVQRGLDEAVFRRVVAAGLVVLGIVVVLGG